jgi:hypothetical protein
MTLPDSSSDLGTLIAQLREWADDTELGFSERFEKHAGAFYRETGMLAPGKSLPLEMSPSDDDARRVAWEEWHAKRRTAFIELLRGAAQELTAAHRVQETLHQTDLTWLDEIEAQADNSVPWVEITRSGPRNTIGRRRSRQRFVESCPLPRHPSPTGRKRNRINMKWHVVKQTRVVAATGTLDVYWIDGAQGERWAEDLRCKLKAAGFRIEWEEPIATRAQPEKNEEENA